MTPELAAAYDRLEAAVKDVASKAGYEGLVTDWVCLAAVQTFDEQGEGWCSVARLLPDGRIPYYRVLGLVDYAHAGLRSQIREADEGGS